MMRRCFIFLIILSMLGISNSWAGGKEAFLKNCGSCHKAGGKAPPVNPADKAGLVWKKYFKRKRHPVDLSSIPKEDMSAILSYLESHAADSDHPEAAAIPK